MKKLFNLNRIKMNEMLEDVSKYIQSIYKQSPHLFTPASPWGQIVLVVTELAQLMLYYIEDSTTELFIDSASRPESIRSLAELVGHNVTRAIAANGSLFLSYNGVRPSMVGNYVIIPNLISLRCLENGLDYVAVLGQDQLRVDLFGVRNKIFLKVIQGKISSQQFTGTGKPIQSFSCVVPSGTNIDNFFVNVYVNGEKYKNFLSLQDIPKGVKGCLIRTGLSSGVDVIFGNGNYGYIPEQGSTILIEYLVTSGEAGNIREVSGIRFEFKEPGRDITGSEVDLNSIFNIGMATTISFGSNPESTSLTRLLAPRQSRSFVYANTDNYNSLFEKMQMFSYIDVFTKFDQKSPWRDLVIYALLLPNVKKRLKLGENYFTVPFKYFTLTSIEQAKILNMIEESGQKILGTIFYFEQPKFKKYAINVNLIVWNGYDKEVIRNEVINKLSEYFLNFKRKDMLPKSDLIAIIEAIDGVDSVNLFFISEEIERELAILLNYETIDASTIITQTDAGILKKLYEDESIKLNKPISDLTVEEKIKNILTLSSVKNYIGKHIDINGDIIFEKGHIPVIRGSWANRSGKMYYDTLNKEKLCSLNINFIKETNIDNFSKINKANINILRK